MRRQRLWIGLFIGGTLILLLLVVSDWLPLLRGPAPETAEWYWPYQIRPWSRWLKPLLAAALTAVVAGWWLRIPSSERRQMRLGLWGVALAIFLLQIALVNADSDNIQYELINRVYSNLASGFFQPAAEITDLGSALADYPALMPTFASEHAQTHPPGLVAANWLTIRLLDYLPALAGLLAPPAVAARCIDLWLLDREAAVAAALVVWALLPLAAAALTVFPAYWCARRLLPETAVPLAVLLVVTLPALLLFAPKVVQLYAPLTLLILLTFLKGWQSWAYRWFFVSGLLLSLATFLSLGNAALLLCLGLLALGFIWQARWDIKKEGRRLLAAGLIFLAGASFVWLIYALGWGVMPWQIGRIGLGRHYALVTNLRRYEWWLLWNWVDVLVFCGWGVALGFMAVLFQAGRRFGGRQLAPNHLLALSVMGLMVTLVVSGSARGEVGRIWLFFMPLLALAAAPFIVGVRLGWRWQMSTVAGQLLLTLALALTWQPVRAVTVAAERPSMPQIEPQTVVAADFGETIRLQGYTASVRGQAVALTLYWEATGQSLRPYTVFNHLVDEQGALVAQQDNWPVAGQWPPTCWSPGETVVDTYHWQLPPDLPDGEYTLLTGFYDGRDGRRLSLSDGAETVTLVSFYLAAGQIVPDS